MARIGRVKSAATSNKSEVDETLAAIRKRFGGNSISAASDIEQPQRIPTGIFTLDYYLLGGIAANRATMIVGERHAGKSLVESKIIANAQKKYPDKQAALIDIEGTYDPVWGAKLGVDNDALILFQPETGEAAVDVADALIGTDGISIVAMDSIAALTPMKEIDSSAEDALVGLQARLVGSMVRKATASMIRERRRGHEVALLFINQFRSKIGGFAGFGEPRSIPGGKALEFATSVQIIIKNKEGKGKDDQGMESMSVNEHSFTITKNKLNGGGRSGEFQILRQNNDEIGLSEGEVDDAATMLLIAKKYGAYSGGGRAWNLEFWNHDITFGNAAEAIAHLYLNRDVYWDLRNFLIASYAESLNMPESFVQRFLE